MIFSFVFYRASASNEAIRLDYATALRNSILQPLVKNGSGGVEESLSFLREYSLLREDVESLNELTMWPGSKDIMSSVDSKVLGPIVKDKFTLFDLYLYPLQLI